MTGDRAGSAEGAGEEASDNRGGVGRRDLLVLGAGVVAGAGIGVGGWAALDGDGDGGGGARDGDSEKKSAEEQDDDAASAPETPETPEPRRFVSTALVMPAVTTWTARGARPAPGLLFTTPRTTNFHGVVLDNDGEAVWLEPDGLTVTDLRVQRYRGRPVLTYWRGEVAVGTGIGAGVILDETYQEVATVRCGNGVFADLHEFRLTSRGTALLVSYPVVERDLTPLDGPEQGFVFDCRVQEVDIATGRVLLDWAALDHLELSETHEEVGDSGASAVTAFDPVHINSVEERGDTLLLCARHTSALYLIDRSTGKVRWRFGGRRSDFEIPEDGRFEAQHDARFHPDGALTIYDNHGSTEKDGKNGGSAALEFELDEKARTATLRRALRHDGHFGYAMGNAERLAGGHTLVGWGTDPDATEFDSAGKAIFEVRGLGEGSYRCYRAEWTGRPGTDPDVGVRDGKAGFEVCASWNGATDVARWRVLAGPGPNTLSEAEAAPRDGFETAVALRRRPPHVAVEALDSDGRVLGTSRTLRT